MKTRSLCVRLRALGIPKDRADTLISIISRWTTCSGPEWTVERLKSLKLEYLSRCASSKGHGDYVAPNFVRNKEGYPAGVWSWLLKQQKEKQMFRVLNTLCVYSSYISSKVTRKQSEKFFGSMQSTDTTGLSSTLKWNEGPLVVQVPEPVPFIAMCASEEKSSPSVLGPSIRRSDALGQLLFFTQSPYCVDAYHRFPLVFRQVVPDNLTRLMQGDFEHHLAFPFRRECLMSVGRISVLQEPGFKLRGIANPNIVWQAALDPLKRIVLKDLDLHFPSDYTHDQYAGVMRIRGWLGMGRTCYSVDLSDATNLMPRHLQMDLLRKRYAGSTPFDDRRLKQMIDAFEFVASKPWYYKDDMGQLSNVRFTRGQPLGLGPSFASFALAHNVLLTGIARSVGDNPNDSFCVLGDDVVICNPKVHTIYRETLKNLGCKVSESKCLISDKVAEFAGQVITPNTVTPIYKWKPLSIHNMFDVCKNYGPRSKTLLPRRLRKVLDAFSPIPVEFGGLGWNPKGIPLQKRMETPLAVYLVDKALTSPKAWGNSLVRYRTLTSLLKDFEKQVHRSQLLPEVVKEEILHFYPSVYNGYVPPTWRNTHLWEWESPAISDSHNRLCDTPSYLLTKYVYLPGETGVHDFRFKNYDDRFGYLYPCGINETGDPRTTEHRQLLRLMFSQCDALTGNATKDQAIIAEIQQSVLEAVGLLRDVSRNPIPQKREEFEFLARKVEYENKYSYQRDLEEVRTESHRRLKF